MRMCVCVSVYMRVWILQLLTFVLVLLFAILIYCHVTQIHTHTHTHTHTQIKRPLSSMLRLWQIGGGEDLASGTVQQGLWQGGGRFRESHTPSDAGCRLTIWTGCRRGLGGGGQAFS